MKELKDVEAVPQKELGKLTKEVKGIGEVQEASNTVGQAKEIEEATGEYSAELDSVKAGNFSGVEERVSTEAAKQVLKVEGVSELQGEPNGDFAELQQQQLEYQQQMEQLKQEKEVKDQLKQRAAERGREFFTEYEDKLNGAQNGYGGYKKKFLRAKNEKWWKLKPNSMKGKPFIERMVVGGYTQVVRLQTSAIDISPILGYKLSGIVVAGVGGTYRLDLGTTGYSPNFDKPVYGYRAYLDAQVYKGFYLHGEYEQMSIELPTITTTATDITSREWVPSVHLGVGKHYSIREKVNGYIQGLYNPLFEYNHSPYAKKFVLRIGLEGVFSKKEKKDEFVNTL